MEPLRCGSLRDVNTTTTNSGLPKKKGSRTPDASKQRNRKSFRRNGGVQSLTPPRPRSRKRSDTSRDPLNIVGNELFVRDHQLSMLEGSEHSMGNRQSSKQEDEENSEIKSLLNDVIIDDEEQYNMKQIQQKLQEERLYNLSKILSTELDNPIDQQLGGIEEVQALLHSYSSSSSANGNSTSSISTVQSSPNTNKGQEQANKILHKIHGKKRISNTHYQKRNIYPNCPNCSNQLIYLYLHHTTTTTACPTVPKLTTSHLHSGTQYNSKSTKYKLQNILPPKCIDCNIYYIYDYISSVYKDIMIDNMMRWLDNIADNDSSSDDVTDDNGTYVNEFGVVVDGSKYPRSSKLVVINSSPKGQDANNSRMDDDVVEGEKKKRGFHETMQISTSFQQQRKSNLTPRPQHERQNSRVSFKFDNEDCPVYPRGDNGDEVEEIETMVVSPRPLFSPRNETSGTIFSGLSSLTEQPQQREGDGGMEVKKSLSDEDPFTDISCAGSDENDMSDDEKNEDVDDDDEDGDSCGSISQWLPNSVNDEEKDNVGEESDEVDICQEDKKDEGDNSQDVAIEDEKIPLALPPPPQAESNDGPKNVEREDEEAVAVEQTQNQVKSESVSSPTPDASSIKSSESNNNNIKLIHTESEERMILEKYSLKKEIATRQIAKDLIQGHELTTLECQRCKMPMTKMKDNEGKFVECTTCQAVKRNAKRIARRKRSKLSIRSGAASVDEDEPHQILSPGSILSQEVPKVPPPDNSKFIDRADHTNLFYFHPDEKGEKIDIPVNALSVLEQGPIVQENENTTLVSLNREEIQDLTALEEGLRMSDEIDPIEILSCTFGNSGDGSSSFAASSDNSIGLNNNVKDKEGDDYWLRHAIMSNNVKQMMIQPNALNPHIYPSAHTPSSTRKEPSASTATDEIEYSLSFYQENVKQQTEEYSRQQSNVVSTSAIAALPSVDELSHSMMSNQYPIPEASRYQLYQETLALENQAAGQYYNLVRSEKEQWLKALAIPLDGSKDKLNLSHHSHSTSLHPESISEVSEYSKQVLGSSSSDESSTRCPRTLPASEMTYQPYYFQGVGGAQLDHAYTGSISEVSGYNERPLVSNDQQQKDITTVDILIGLSSDESMTKCPRDLPPSDMIWDSQPTPSATVYPVQSIASGDHQQAIKSTDDNLRRIATSQEKVTQGPTLLTPFDLQNVEDDHNKVDTKLNSEVDTEDNSVVSGEKGDASALLQASLSPSSLNERIARLADSLREVASQLPKESESKQTPLSEDTKFEEENIMHNDMLSVLGGEEEEEEEEEDPSSQVPHIHQRTFSPIQQPVNEYQFEEEIVDQQTRRHRSPLHRLQSAPLAISPYTFQPIPLRSNSVGNNGHGISISPINVCRDEKQFDLFSSGNDDEGEEEVIVHSSPKKVQRCDHIIKTPQECIRTSPPPQEGRADPPGRSVQASGHEIRDPPENDSTTNDDHNHTTHSPNSKGISSTNLTQVSEKNQSARDPPPSTTPSRGRRRKRLIAACNDDDVTEEKLVREMKVAASRPDFIHRNKPITKSDDGMLSLEVDDDAYSIIDAPQSTKSSGSMNELFQQIDDLEIDFQRTIASMPGSEGMSSASLKSYSNDNHSLVEITLNNGINSMGSFESDNHLAEDEDSLVSGVVRKIKDCIARVESVDEEDDCRSDVDTVSQCESETMSVLMNRLATTVGELL